MSVQIIREKKAHIPVSETNPPVNYVEAASVPCERVELSLEEIQQYYGLLEKICDDVFISSPKQVISSVKSVMITYKTFNPKSKSIEYMDREIVEKCLNSVRKNVTFFTRGYRYATVDVSLSSAEKSRELSDKTLKTE